MCFDTDSTPPTFADAGQAVMTVDSTSVTLRSGDGTLFSGFLARPDRPSGVGIVVLPDIRGLFRFYELLAVRLAEQAHTALRLHYFGRTAAPGPRTDKFPYI